MYEGHFQLERRPFATTPDASCCFLSPSHAPQFQNVVQCVEEGRGIAILTGPAGIGKTLLSQVLLTELESRFTGVYLGTGQFPTRRAFLQAILYELGQPYGGMTDQELRLELNTALRNLITQKDGLLLILDEAHILSDRLLEEVRLLADLAHRGVPLVRAVLCGNPEFEERLTAPSLSAFNQRVACHESLETLLRSESINYLEYRVQWAGGTADRLFEPAAMQLIAEASDGVPRCLNQLAEHSLTHAFRADETIASESIVRQALAAVQHLPLRWNASALLSRSWRSTAESSDAASTIRPIDAPPTNISSQAEELTTSHESASACFEFGAGDDSDSTTSLNHIERHASPDEIPTEPAAFSSESNLGGSSSIELGGPKTLEFGEKSFEIPPSNDAGESESASFEIGGPTSATIEIETESTSAQRINQIMEMHSAPDSRERKVVLRVSMNDGSANKSESTQKITSSHTLEGIALEDRSTSAGADVEYRQTTTLSDESIDHDQPRFAWLNHPVELAETESGAVFNSSIAEDAVSELKFSSRIRARSQPKSHEVELVDTSSTRSNNRRPQKSSASRSTATGPKMQPGDEQKISRDAMTMHSPELEEEVIVDRYAAFDVNRGPAIQRRSPGQKNAISQPAVEHPAKFADATDLDGAAANSAAIANDAETERKPVLSVDPETRTEAPPIVADDEYRQSPMDPMEQFDSICALLETADEHSNGGSGVELITDWGVERIDVDLSSEMSGLDLSDSGQQMPGEITDWLGSTVVEVGRDLQIQISEPQQKATESLPGDDVRDVQRGDDEQQQSQTERPEATLTVPQSPDETLVRASQFDIVEPDPHAESVTAGSVLSDAQQHADALREEIVNEEPLERPVRSTTHSRFHSLFTSLRRRQVSAGN